MARGRPLRANAIRLLWGSAHRNSKWAVAFGDPAGVDHLGAKREGSRISMIDIGAVVIQTVDRRRGGRACAFYRVRHTDGEHVSRLVDPRVGKARDHLLTFGYRRGKEMGVEPGLGSTIEPAHRRVASVGRRVGLEGLAGSRTAPHNAVVESIDFGALDGHEVVPDRGTIVCDDRYLPCRGLRGRGWARLAGVGIDHQRGLVDCLDMAAMQKPELMQLVVVPARVGRAAQEPAAAVVRQKHAVFLERAQNDFYVRSEARDVDTGFEAEALAHGRILRPA